MSQDKAQALPKFGEWDVNDPASAEGFTVIFNKARDEKKTGGSTPRANSPGKEDGAYKQGAYASKTGAVDNLLCCYSWTGYMNGTIWKTLLGILPTPFFWQAVHSSEIYIRKTGIPLILRANLSFQYIFPVRPLKNPQA